MLKTCIFVLALCCGVAAPSYASTKIGDFLRYQDGSVLTFPNQLDAVQACKKIGARLPTAREIAIKTQAQGGIILEVPDYRAGKIPAGMSRSDFHLVYVTNDDGTDDRFFVSYKNFHLNGNRDDQNYSYWSSSVSAFNSSMSIDFDPGAWDNGGVNFPLKSPTEYDSNDSIGARCITSPERNVPVSEPETAPPQPKALGDWVRNSYGEIILSNQFSFVPSAEKYCESMHSRLPTIREILIDATQYGMSILEVADYKANKIPSDQVKDNYWLIDSIDSAGDEDRFYYSPAHYNQDDLFFGEWSSTRDYYNDAMYDFAANDGTTKPDTSYNGRCAPGANCADFAVRCVATQQK